MTTLNDHCTNLHQHLRLAADIASRRDTRLGDRIWNLRFSTCYDIPRIARELTADANEELMAALDLVVADAEGIQAIYAKLY